MDLAALTEADRETLLEDIGHSFYEGEGALAEHGTMVTLTMPYPPAMTDAELVALQGEVQQILAGLVGDWEPTEHGGPLGLTRVTVSKQLIPHDQSDRSFVWVTGAPRDVYLEYLFHLAIHVGVDRIRRCPAPDCGRLFIRERRQKYCTRECTNRALWSSYSPKQKRKWRQKQYDKNGWTVGARTARTQGKQK